ncbi:GLPGLI family protein [Pedobacter cryoconitis]|uniref:GLPGLI family protein n=1 Tax=Pedobacter cryoconitis TaxID=188932 RepID=A0A7W8ZP26_9SPHI|nr:GLPGLI family protein [Pedobacter cryoconitis]MBB5637556.1 GLPGLI family protein [Pedobacter cryoconitis]
MKKSTIIILTCLFIGFSTSLLAQNSRFTTQGEIEFERSTNMYAIIQKRINKDNEGYMSQFFEQYKKTSPQFKLAKSTLTFSNQLTLFKPIADDSPAAPFFGEDPGVTQINITYTDLNTSQQITQKKVFEETFLVKDSTRTIRWKITDETREIAGFNCRRANALVMDSIYVVAFYTDQIPVSGGPESFTGLPGMILGLALPHENVTWFAKTVSDRSVATNKIIPPVKGKATDNKGLKLTLTAALKNWGEYAKGMFKAFLL